MKKTSVILSVILVIFSCIFFGGCTQEMVSLYIYKMPTKLVYALGEELDISGLELKNIKTDSALLKIYNNKANFSGFDSSTPGKKEISVSYGKFTTSFSVYVANKVVKTSDELKTAIESASDGDIILIKAGEYKLSNPIEILNSNLVIAGEGMNKTIVDAMFLIGGNLNENEITYGIDTQNISFITLGFKTKNSVQNNIIKFENEFLTQQNACINAKNLTKFNVISCSFEGYSFGIKAENMTDVFISSSTFKNLLIGGIYSTESTKNTTISKNIITQIGANVANLNDNGEQEHIFGISLAFASEENLGVSIYKNSINKIAIKSSNLKFFNEILDGNFAGLNYLNNSGAIILFSSSKNNLQTKGVSIFFNSMGATLNNILYGTNSSNNVNSASVMYMSL